MNKKIVTSTLLLLPFSLSVLSAEINLITDSGNSIQATSMSNNESQYTLLGPKFDISDRDGNPLQDHYDVKKGKYEMFYPKSDVYDITYDIQTNLPNDIELYKSPTAVGFRAINDVENATITITATSESMGGTSSSTTMTISAKDKQNVIMGPDFDISDNHGHELQARYDLKVNDTIMFKPNSNSDSELSYSIQTNSPNDILVFGSDYSMGFRVLNDTENAEVIITATDQRTGITATKTTLVSAKSKNNQSLVPDFEITDFDGYPLKPHYDLKIGETVMLQQTSDADDLTYEIESSSADVMVFASQYSMSIRPMHEAENVEVKITATSASLGTSFTKKTLVSAKTKQDVASGPDFDVTDSYGHPMQPSYDLKRGDIIQFKQSSQNPNLTYSINSSSPSDIQVWGQDANVGMRVMHAVQDVAITITAFDRNTGEQGEKTTVISAE
ncbi:hypothetical protein BS333_05955 [Vibrio azureus]|uniref:Cadherin domain-containing protein n=1 Tax=Vibrio azureus NBRC 104587 TaxID=1219077 RepID=U3BY66_9VIBR|nr:hypothetical protein [Vibrio azureus]AUI85962.1 hypothetical protein BS333_05955 [Vibrio azureus]GAD74269.1 hypothetical protein VAZ01S_008_00110 [Vibrio azureus NBRC 104587]